LFDVTYLKCEIFVYFTLTGLVRTSHFTSVCERYHVKGIEVSFTVKEVKMKLLVLYIVYK